MIRSFVNNMLLLLGVILISLLVIEGVLRLFPAIVPQAVNRALQLADPAQMGVSHPYIGHLHTPNNALVIPNPDFKAVHHTDANGFRNTDPWPTQADMVILGDSLTFGYGVEDRDSWPAIIARTLPHLSVVNLGLIGAGPEQYVRVYETFGTQLHPKVVIVGLYPDNDFWDAGLFAKWLKSKTGGSYMVWRNLGRITPSDTGVRRLSKQSQSFLKQHSLLFNLTEHARNLYRSRHAPRSLTLSDGTDMKLWPKKFSSRARGSKAAQPEFQLVVQSLTRLQTLTTAQGAQLIILILPSKEHLYTPLLGETVPDPNLDLSNALEQLGINYLDLTPSFQSKVALGKALFFGIDSHPNRNGYALIAAEALKHIKLKLTTP